MNAPQLLHAPQQERSRNALERIYQAVNILAQEKSFDKTTIGEIVVASNVAVGSFYQRFASKDDLLWELYGRYIEEAAEAINEVIDGTENARLDDRIKNIIEVVSTLFVMHRGIIRSFILKFRSSPEEVPAQHLVRLSENFSRVDQYLRVEGVSAKSAKLCRSFVVSGCREHLLFGAIEGLPQRKNSQEFKNLLFRSAKAVL